MIIDREEAKLFMFWMALAVCVGWLCGWVHAHKTVASECEKLGGFYVGKVVFKCVAVEDAKQ